jgi:hypothetical protein
MDFKNLTKNETEPKVGGFCQMFVISIKKARTLGKKTIPSGMHLKIYRKSLA